MFKKKKLLKDFPIKENFQTHHFHITSLTTADLRSAVKDIKEAHIDKLNQSQPLPEYTLLTINTPYHTPVKLSGEWNTMKYIKSQ